MKILLIGGVIIITIFSIFQIYTMKSTRNTEMLTYKVLKKFKTFEIRKYPSANFTYVKMNSKSYENNSSYGFRKLAGYIFGGNSKNEKIAMTSPVSTNISGNLEMQFMVPKSKSMESLPTPNDSDVHFKKEPEKIVAAITFGGWVSDKRIEKYTELLKKELVKNKIPYLNKVTLLGYNPPYEMLNRKNEIIVELDANSLTLN